MSSATASGLFVLDAIYRANRRVARGELVFDGLELEEHRPRLDPDELRGRCAQLSGYAFEGLASRRLSPDVVRGRIELAVLAVTRNRLGSCDVAAALDKDPPSVSH